MNQFSFSLVNHEKVEKEVCSSPGTQITRVLSFKVKNLNEDHKFGK